MQEIQQCLKWAVLALTLLGPLLASAAQDAIVAVDQAPIRERPATDAKVIESLLKGKTVRVSNKVKDGWFKARTKDGQIGWISQDDLTLLNYQKDFDNGRMQLQQGEQHERREFESDPFVYFSAGLAVTTMFSQDFSQAVGLDGTKTYLALGGFGDLSFEVIDRLRIGLRYMSFSNTTSVQFQCTNCPKAENYQITREGHPLMLGVEGRLSGDGSIASIQLDGGFYFGYELPHRVSLVTTTEGQPNSFLLEQHTIAALANITVTYSFFKWLRAIGGLGFYYSALNKVQIPNSFNGDTAFRSSSNLLLGQVDSVHMGPLVTFGLQLAY